MPKRLEIVSVNCIVAIALVLRLWGIGFGLPYLYHFDEHFYINTALQLGAGVWNNPPYAATGLSNLFFGEYALFYVVGWLFGWFDSTAQFETTYRSDPTAFYLLGRIAVVALATTTVLVTYVLGSVVRSYKSGLLAALLLAVTLLHVRDSHYAVPDAVTPLFIVLAVTLAIRSLGEHRRRRRWRLVLAGVAGGLAIAVKWIALPVVLPVCWASFCRSKQLIDVSEGKKVQPLLLLAVAGLALGFLLGSPQILMNPAPYVREAIGQYSAGQTGGFEFWQVDEASGWLFYLNTLVYGLGPVFAALAIVGGLRRLARVIRTRECISWLLILFPGIYYLLMGSTRHYFARYALPLTPFMALFAAEVIVVTAEWLKNKKGAGLSWVIFGVITAATVAQPLANSLRHDMLLTRTDTRMLAKRWIERNIPAGARIALDWPTHGPPLSTPDRSVPVSDRVYDVTTIGGAGLSEHSVDWYREQGFEYLIASSFIYQIPLLSPEQDQQRKAFYASLGRDLTEVQVIYPTGDGSEPNFIFDEIYGPVISLWQRERPGPTLRIYQLRP